MLGEGDSAYAALVKDSLADTASDVLTFASLYIYLNSLRNVGSNIRFLD